MAQSLPSAALEEAAAARDPRRRDDGGAGSASARRWRREETAAVRTAAVREAGPPVGASEDLRGQLSNGLARIVVPVSLRQIIVRATERWRSRHYGPVHGHCRRRGCGGDPHRKSCREHAGSRFPSDGERCRGSRQALRATAGWKLLRKLSPKLSRRSFPF